MANNKKTFHDVSVLPLQSRISIIILFGYIRSFFTENEYLSYTARRSFVDSIDSFFLSKIWKGAFQGLNNANICPMMAKCRACLLTVFLEMHTQYSMCEPSNRHTSTLWSAVVLRRRSRN